MRSQVNSRARARPRRAQCSQRAPASSSSRWSASKRSPAPRAGRTAARRRPPPPAGRRRSSRRPAPPGPSPPAPAGRSPRTARGTRTPAASAHSPSSSSAETHAGKRTSASTLERACALAQLGLVRGGIAGEHEHRTALGREPRERTDQREQVLVRPLGGDAQEQPGARRARTAPARRSPAAAAHAARRRGRAERRRSRSEGTPSSPIRSSRVLCESAITRSERRTAHGTSTFMPLSRMPAWASGKRA